MCYKNNLFAIKYIFNNFNLSKNFFNKKQINGIINDGIITSHADLKMLKFVCNKLNLKKTDFYLKSASINNLFTVHKNREKYVIKFFNKNFCYSKNGIFFDQRYPKFNTKN